MGRAFAQMISVWWLLAIPVAFIAGTCLGVLVTSWNVMASRGERDP